MDNASTETPKWVKPEWPSISKRTPLAGGTISEVARAKEEDPSHIELANKVIDCIVQNANAFSGGDQARGVFSREEYRTISRVDKPGEPTMVLVSSDTESRLGALVDVEVGSGERNTTIQCLAFPEGDLYRVGKSLDDHNDSVLAIDTISLPVGSNAERYELLNGVSESEAASLTNGDKVLFGNTEKNGGISVNPLTSSQALEAETPQRSVIIKLIDAIGPDKPAA